MKGFGLRVAKVVPESYGLQGLGFRVEVRVRSGYPDHVGGV